MYSFKITLENLSFDHSFWQTIFFEGEGSICLIHKDFQHLSQCLVNSRHPKGTGIGDELIQSSKITLDGGGGEEMRFVQNCVEV